MTPEGKERWGIFSQGECYNKKTGRWEYEPLLSSREDGWLDEVRFSFGEAVHIATLMAPHISWNYLTVPVALKALSFEDRKERYVYIDAESAACFDRRKKMVEEPS